MTLSDRLLRHLSLHLLPQALIVQSDSSSEDVLVVGLLRLRLAFSHVDLSQVLLICKELVLHVVFGVGEHLLQAHDLGLFVAVKVLEADLFEVLGDRAVGQLPETTLDQVSRHLLLLVQLYQLQVHSC